MYHQITSSRSIDSDQRERGLHALNRPSFNRSISPEPAPSYSRHADSPHRSFRESGSSSEQMIFRIRQKSQMHNGHLTADDRQILNDLEASQDQIDAVSQWQGRLNGGGQTLSSIASAVGEVAAGESSSSSSSEPLSPRSVKRARSPQFPSRKEGTSSKNINSFDMLLAKEPGKTASHVGVVLEMEKVVGKDRRTGKNITGKEKKVLESVPGSGVIETDLRKFCEHHERYEKIVWVASPSYDLKSELNGKESQAQDLFETEYKRKVGYNSGMIDEGRYGRLHCGEFVSEFIGRLSGKEVAPLRGLPFHEQWQQDYYEMYAKNPEKLPKLEKINGRPVPDPAFEGYLHETNGPFKTKPPYPRGVAPSDPVSRRHYNVKFAIDLRK